MPFKKGVVTNPDGRPVGAVSEKRKHWEQLGEWFTTEGAQRAKEIMMKSDDEAFMNHYKNLIELFKPKLQRTENTNLNAELTVIKIIREDTKSLLENTSQLTAGDIEPSQEV